MDTVLILGNGISRLLYHKEILAFDGEIWGCNFIFLEYGDILGRVVGHRYVMDQAELWKKYKNFPYDVHYHEEWEEINRTIRGNSGAFLVAMAIEEEREITLCGMDFGGPDIYSPNQEIRPSGIRRRFRLIEKIYGSYPMKFWGKKPEEPFTVIPGYENLVKDYWPVGKIYEESG